MGGRFAQIKRTVVSVVGFFVLFLGIAMILLPGPAFILIPLGLGILASEYPWARRMLNRIKGWFRKEPAKDQKEGVPTPGELRKGE